MRWFKKCEGLTDIFGTSGRLRRAHIWVRALWFADRKKRKLKKKGKGGGNTCELTYSGPQVDYVGRKYGRVHE